MTAPGWRRALACTLTLLTPLALARPTSLALPPAGAAATGPVRDTPPPRPDTVDLGAIEDAALAQADRLPPATWDVPVLALELAFDLPAMHAFVRDHVAFDPYAGVLRGAQGTLSARAGNAWDRALLLHALVTASDYEARFAFGTPDDAAVASMLAAAPVGAAVPLDDPPVAAVLASDLGRIADRARRDHALLLDALAGQAFGGDEPDRAVLVRDHVWVQAPDDDGVWRDLDPAAPYGEALATAMTTSATLQAARAIEAAQVDGVSLAITSAALRVLGPADLAKAEGPALREASERGELAVLVGDPTRFWAIDPTSGATRSVLEPGLRVGFVGGGNYVKSAGGGVRYVVDEATGRTLGYIKDGKF